MTELELLQKHIRERFVKAFATYHLLEDEDYVLVGLSGGKDSLCLLEMLAWRSKINHPHFRIEAVHVRMENILYETDTAYLERFCQKLSIPLHIITTRFETSDKKPPCFLCSWYRRKELFNLAQQLGCNKIALGHHQDDLIHTALMNLFYQGRFDTMPALLRMRKMPLVIIRPLCMVAETDIQRYAELCCYEKQVKICPYEGDSHRTDMRRLFEHIQMANPEARHSLWNAIVRAGKLVSES
ncbi:MAG: tRNA 2-thiocytidine biosynthesis TtcA family protein [Prevotella sp.]|nr:tRNA 2-thiocytidine biosynthesis TtcA family protein [Prevotella sp.]MDE6011496.1 tRNA 2-thiocytidine biosynthesis TtcA family protein [Prevotella sp.]